MSGETATPAADTAAPVQNGADTAVETKTPAAAESEEFLPETPESEAKPEGKAEGKAEDGKAEAKSEDKADDFLAETDDDDAESKADTPGDAKQEGEPEPYQPFTLPDGLELDEAVIAEATPLLRKFNLDQEGAQELVSFYAAKTASALEAYHLSLAEGHQQTLKTWSAELKALPEYKGQALKEAKGRVAEVLSKIGTPQLRTLLDKDYGLIRHPEVFKFLDAISTKLSPDSLVRDDAGASEKTAPQRVADQMYS